MANVYVEARAKGRPEGSPIQDYVVEDHTNHVLGTFKPNPSSGRKQKVTLPLSLASGI